MNMTEDMGKDLKKAFHTQNIFLEKEIHTLDIGVYCCYCHTLIKTFDYQKPVYELLKLTCPKCKIGYKEGLRKKIDFERLRKLRLHPIKIDGEFWCPECECLVSSEDETIRQDDRGILHYDDTPHGYETHYLKQSKGT